MVVHPNSCGRLFLRASHETNPTREKIKINNNPVSNERNESATMSMHPYDKNQIRHSPQCDDISNPPPNNRWKIHNNDTPQQIIPPRCRTSPNSGDQKQSKLITASSHLRPSTFDNTQHNTISRTDQSRKNYSSPLPNPFFVFVFFSTILLFFFADLQPLFNPPPIPPSAHRRYQIGIESKSGWLVPVVTICKIKR